MDDDRVSVEGTPSEGNRSRERARRRRVKQLRGSSYDVFVEALNALSATKQVVVMDAWRGVEMEFDTGVKITARSKKELRRFTRAQDPAMFEWLRSFDDDEVLYDIGANCGSVALAAGVMHRDHIRIVAIEPGYASFESLVRNLSHNNLLASSIPLQVALLDRTGLQPLNYYRSTAAGTSLHAVGEAVDHEGRAFTPVEAQMMPTFALDDLIEVLELPRPTRMKIDVDGSEEAVLRGAPRTLAAGTIRDLAVEIVDHDRAGTRIATISGLLGEHGYEPVETFRHHGDEGFVADYLFKRDEKQAPQTPPEEHRLRR